MSSRSSSSHKYNKYNNFSRGEDIDDVTLHYNLRCSDVSKLEKKMLSMQKEMKEDREERKEMEDLFKRENDTLRAMLQDEQNKRNEDRRDMIQQIMEIKVALMRQRDDYLELLKKFEDVNLQNEKMFVTIELIKEELRMNEEQLEPKVTESIDSAAQTDQSLGVINVLTETKIEQDQEMEEDRAKREKVEGLSQIPSHIESGIRMEKAFSKNVHEIISLPESDSESSVKIEEGETEVTDAEYEKDVRARLREHLKKGGISEENITVLEKRPLHYAYAPHFKSEHYAYSADIIRFC